jgi:hypothetical protein
MSRTEGSFHSLRSIRVSLPRENPADLVAASDVSPAASRSSRSLRASRRRRTVGLPATSSPPNSSVLPDPTAEPWESDILLTSHIILARSHKF